MAERSTTQLLSLAVVTTVVLIVGLQLSRGTLGDWLKAKFAQPPPGGTAGLFGTSAPASAPSSAPGSPPVSPDFASTVPAGAADAGAAALHVASTTKPQIAKGAA